MHHSTRKHVWVCGIHTLEKNLAVFFQISHLQAVSCEIWGGNNVAGFYSLPKLTCKKILFFFFPFIFFQLTNFGKEIGIFVEENYFPLKNVTGAAHLVVENLFLWLFRELDSLKLIIGLQLAKVQNRPEKLGFKRKTCKNSQSRVCS